MTEKTLPYEQAAEIKTGIEGWVCKTCRRFYGEEEHLARYCCAASRKCGNEGCQGRATSAYIYCDDCLDKRRLAKWHALPAVPWDEKTPLVLHDDDRYFFSADDLYEYAEELGVKPEDLRLVLCVEERKPTFDMYEFLQDYLVDGQEYDADWEEIDKKVNAWIKENVPVVWVEGSKRPTLDSIRNIFAKDAAVE